MGQTALDVGDERREKFVPPSVDEVRAWVERRGYHFDPQQFVDYYEAENWHMGNGRKVKSWKRCCVTWERNAGKDGLQGAEKVDVGLPQFGSEDEVVGNWEDRREKVPILRS